MPVEIEGRTKFIIVSATRISGKHIDKGTILELDPKIDRKVIGDLNHAGRIALATPEVVEQIRAEVEAEEDSRPPQKPKRQAQQPQQQS